MKAESKIQAISLMGLVGIAALSLALAAVTWSQAESDPVSKGSQVYQGKKCALCHSI